MPKHLTAFILAIIGVVLIAFLARYAISDRQVTDFSPSPGTTETTVPFVAPKGTLRAIVASSSDARTRGLSGRASLDIDSGMLFIFPTPGRYGFWMKDMNFPIDIIWIDSNRQVVGIQQNATPDSFPDVFMPPSDVLYVLEINAGKSPGWGIATGTALIF